MLARGNQLLDHAPKNESTATIGDRVDFHRPLEPAKPLDKIHCIFMRILGERQMIESDDGVVLLARATQEFASGVGGRQCAEAALRATESSVYP